MDEQVYLSLLTQVRQLKDNVNMEQRYTVNPDCPYLTDEQRQELIESDNSYEANLRLKELVSQNLNDAYDNYDVDFWIVQTWGRINKFRDTPANREKIDAFAQGIQVGVLNNLQSIPSLSKIAAFVNPMHYFVYDSRVAYTLNWLLLKANARSGFFPMLPSLNRNLNEFNLKKCIRDITGNQRPYLNKRTAYFEYCSLIIRLYNDLYSEEADRPFKVEMLLFTVAPNEIYTQIRDHFQETNNNTEEDENILSSEPRKPKMEIIKDCKIRKRDVTFGFKISTQEGVLYLFIGELEKCTYCEILTESKNKCISDYPLAVSIFEQGIISNKGALNNDYIYQIFDKGDYASAFGTLSNVLNEWKTAL